MDVGYSYPMIMEGLPSSNRNLNLATPAGEPIDLATLTECSTCVRMHNPSLTGLKEGLLVKSIGACRQLSRTELRGAGALPLVRLRRYSGTDCLTSSSLRAEAALRVRLPNL